MSAIESTALDSRIVRETQAGLPLTARPYLRVAERLGVSEAAVRERLAAMLADGRIRRIGAVPNHYALGYRANAMSVWDVADEAVDELGAAVGALPFVSHCYRRPRRFVPSCILATCRRPVRAGVTIFASASSEYTA